MTDTPPDPRDVVVKPPPATVYAKAGLAATVVMNVTGVVERLTSEGASDQTILEAIRSESPEIASVAEATPRPQGWTSHDWFMAIIALYMAIVMTYGTFRPQESPTPAEIAQIVRDTFANLPPPQDSPRPKEEPPPSGGTAEPK